MSKLTHILVLATMVLAVVLISCTAQTPEETTPPVKSLLNQGEYIPDIATFLQIGGCSPSGYSWDGRDIYFTSHMSGVSQIYRITDEGWPYQLTTFEDGIDFFVLGYTNTMAIVGASTGGSEQSQLFLMDTHTGRVLQLTDTKDIQYGSVTWAKNDKHIYFRSNEENGRDFFLYKMDIATGKYHKIFGDTATVAGYNFIGDLSKDGTKMIIGHLTSNINDDLYLLDLTTDKYQKLTEDESDVIYDSPTLMPDGKTIWLTCNDNDDGISRIAKMTVGSPEVEYIEDGWINPKWEVGGLSFSRDYKYMSAVINEDGYGKLKMREVQSGHELKSPSLDGILGLPAFDRNGSCIFSFTSPTRAPEVWKYTPQSDQVKQMTFSIYAGIDRKLFSNPELVHYKSFDDLEIPAFLYLPPDYVKGEPIPFIVHAHGGPESQYRPYFLRNIQYLILNGYGVLAPNPRGSSGYGRKYLNLDNYKNRKHSLMDYKAGVEWLIKNDYTKKGIIGIRGGSYGGYVVLGMITEYPDLFSAAVDVVGIANFKSFLENTKPYRRALRESEYGPLSDPDFLREVSPIHKANLIKTPLMVVHGENDPRVPVGEARQIISAIKANGGVVDSLIFPDEGHGTRKRANTITEYRKQVEFFSKQLKPITQ
ncbi:MAG: S9 family peptidase [candidate division Zixibacteria bacterium]|nr:S9 family peptidase [candidate division Zixibacteria bacterium]